MTRLVAGIGNRGSGVAESRTPPPGPRSPGSVSLLPKMERQLAPELIDFLREAGRVGDRMGFRVFAAGGFVRDLLLGRPTLDLDLVVQGDGLAFARRLARKIGGRLSVHRAFGTATIEGSPAGRVDVAAARRERYAEPGALPAVTMRVSILEDLYRRDFTINAMAASLSPETFGKLLDPAGGHLDIRRRKIRVLHALSFIEDPTRIFRAIRYAVRLGFTLDKEIRRLLKAAGIGEYPALSGQRLLAEIDLTSAEARPHRALVALGRAGAFRLLDASYRFSQIASRRLMALGDFSDWCGEKDLALPTRGLALLALTEHLSREKAERFLGRLSLSGEPLERLLAARRDGPALAESLSRLAPGSLSACAALLRGHPPETIGWAWCLGSDSARQVIEWFLAEGRGHRPILTGDDLLALGVPKGPAVGALLDRLRDARLDGTVTTRDEEIAVVKSWSETQGAPQKEG